MAISMSEKEARRAGLIKGKPSTKKRADGGRRGARSICAACGAEFTSDTRETEHMEQTGHNRYEIPLSEASPSDSERG
jgi:DNA-directed RNA polymerase subunit RPC12/RpoP